MSNGRRHRRAVGSLHRNHCDNVGIAVIYATVDRRTPEAVAAGKVASHDRLIAQLGPRRRSAVRWMVLPPEEAGPFLLDTQETALATERYHAPMPAGVGQLDTPDEVLAFFADYPDGLLVVAMADAVRP